MKFIVDFRGPFSYLQSVTLHSYDSAVDYVSACTNADKVFVRKEKPNVYNIYPSVRAILKENEPVATVTAFQPEIED